MPPKARPLTPGRDVSGVAVAWVTSQCNSRRGAARRSSPLAAVREAHEQLEREHSQGKTVLAVA